MNNEGFARTVRRMRSAQKLRDARATATNAARCEAYESVVDEALIEVLGPEPVEYTAPLPLSAPAPGLDPEPEAEPTVLPAAFDLIQVTTVNSPANGKRGRKAEPAV